jgi:hypothetical protein
VKNQRSFVLRLIIQVGLFYAVSFFLYVSGDRGKMLLGRRKLPFNHRTSPSPGIAHNHGRENNSAQLYMFYISHDRTSAQSQLKLSCLFHSILQKLKSGYTSPLLRATPHLRRIFTLDSN